MSDEPLHNPAIGPSQSVKILEELCRQFLGSQPVFLYSGTDLVWPTSADIHDVVMMGNPFAFLSEPRFWYPNMELKLWVLSSKHRDVLCEVFALESDSIGVIPRYSLMPRARQTSDRFQNLIYSGRLRQSKNIALVAAVAKLLSDEQPIEFHICGPAIDPVEIDDLLTSSKVAASFHSDLGLQWASRFGSSSRLISLSTSYEEDFGVSIAQAQAAGMGVICSAWGAHHDVENALKIPASWVFESRHSSLKFEEIARRIASHILANNLPVDSVPSMRQEVKLQKTHRYPELYQRWMTHSVFQRARLLSLLGDQGSSGTAIEKSMLKMMSGD